MMISRDHGVLKFSVSNRSRDRQDSVNSSILHKASHLSNTRLFNRRLVVSAQTNRSSFRSAQHASAVSQIGNIDRVAVNQHHIGARARKLLQLHT